jgi:hypothetical protein
MSELRNLSREIKPRIAHSQSRLLLPHPYKPKYRYVGRFVDAVFVVVAIGFVVFALLVLGSDGRPLIENAREQALLMAASYVFGVLYTSVNMVINLLLGPNSIS